MGFYLLFRIPLLWAGILAGAITFLMTGLERYGHRTVEIMIGSLVSVISICYIIELFLAKPDWGQVAYHTVVPIINSKSILIAVGMLGATVMPHVIYLHSEFAGPARGTMRPYSSAPSQRKDRLIVAINIAFIINAAMVVVSAAVFFRRGINVVSIEQAHQTLAPLLGPLSCTAFGIALLASGLSSSTVGTMAGQVNHGRFRRAQGPGHRTPAHSPYSRRWPSSAWGLSRSWY